MKPLFRGLTLGMVIAMSACTKGEQPDYTRLGSLRVLAIQADQPEVDPGTSVTLTPLISDIAGAGRTLSYTAQACTDPGVGYGATPTCEGSPTRVAVGAGTLTPVGPMFTEAAPTLAVVVPLTALAGRSAADQYNGVPYLVTYRLSAADGSAVDSFKRILVTSPTKATKNQNPGALSVLLDGAPLTALPTVASAFALSVAGTGAEDYSFQQSDGGQTPATEILATTWFLSDGAFERYRTLGIEPLTYTPAATAPVGHSTVISVVTRDGRGGIAYRVYSF